jgi:hypothetical protein
MKDMKNIIYAFKLWVSPSVSVENKMVENKQN